jgi:hypothetical protein
MYSFDLLVYEDFQIVKKTEKHFYNTDKLCSLKNWANNGKIKTFDLPQLSSPLLIKNKGRGKLSKDAIGYFLSGGNNVGENAETVAILSSSSSKGNGFSITQENFTKVTCSFVARRAIQKNWTNEKDEYLAPNEEHELYGQFKFDSLIYSLFESKSIQSSLRQITYKDKLWDIKNEFFWISKNEMLELANENNYSDLYNDARTDSDRHVYKLLFGEERIYQNLSPDAKLVLDKATELVRKSMQMREAFANDENHLKSWDAGYAQLKLLWKEYYAEDFKEFRELYKKLEDRMRPMVYELGFLMK